MSEKFPRVEGREVVRALERSGFEVRRQKGSHVHLRRESDGRRVTVPVHSGQTLPLGTLRAVLRDAGVEPADFRKLI